MPETSLISLLSSSMSCLDSLIAVVSSISNTESFPAVDACYSDTVLPLFLGLCLAHASLRPHQTDKVYELYEEPQKIYRAWNSVYQELRDKEHNRNSAGRDDRLVRSEIVFLILSPALVPNN
jgi:hypothetical protein